MIDQSGKKLLKISKRKEDLSSRDQVLDHVAKGIGTSGPTNEVREFVKNEWLALEAHTWARRSKRWAMVAVLVSTTNILLIGYLWLTLGI